MWFEPLAHLRSPLAGYCRRCLEVAITPSSSLEAFYYRVAAMQSRYCDKHLSVRCLLYTSPSPRDGLLSRMPSSA